MQPDRIFHNGIIKGPSKRNGKNVPDSEILGPTKKVDGVTWLTGSPTISSPSTTRS
jgi:hypothetical protein